jgi:CHAT domain-containing protein/lipopolysaccharide biosynthesis regulator YciM
MQLYTISSTILITLFATVSIPFTVYSATANLATQPSVSAQDSRKTQADQLVKQGIEQYQKGQIEAAIGFWQQALSLYQQLQDRQGESTTLKYLGATYLVLNNYTKAIEFLEPFLAIAQASGDRQGEALALGNLGIAYKQLGDYNKAIESHQKALALMREIKNRQGEGQVLGNLGNAYEGLGNYDKAIKSYQQSLTIAREVKDQLGEGAALGNLGAIYANQGKYDKAIESYKQSLTIAQEIGDKDGQGTTLNNLGVAYHVQGNLTQAVDFYTQALSLARAISDRKLEAETLGGLGLAYEDQRDFAKAIDHQQQTLKIAQAIGDRRLEAMAFNNLGHTLFSSGNLPEAEKNLRDAMQRFESLRPGLTDIDKVSVLDTQVFSYNLLQQILVAQNKSEAALEIAERGRARAFVELLASRLSPEVALQATTNSQPPTIEQIKQIAQAHNATLVEYTIVPDDEFKFQGKLRGKASELFIWVVQPTGKVDFRRIDLKFLQQEQGQAQSGTGSTSLEELVSTSRRMRGAWASRGERARKKLHQLLIEPIVELLPKDPNARIIFIPQESLFLLPFPALQAASGQYLIEKHTILTAPAIQVLDLTRQQQQRLEAQHTKPLQGKDVLIVGNPTMPTLKHGEDVEQLAPLPGAEQEALALAKLMNTQAIIGDKATKVSIVEQLPKARLIHLATHGLLDDIRQLGVPGAIALAPSPNHDGFLTAGEILNLKLNAELVVMSACHTGQGEITGDGVIGLSRSLIAAGVPSTIVSLWAVPDAATAMLMTEFYRHFQQNPDKAQALRNAMLTTMKQYPEPINWAAFTLIGEAK